MLLIAGDVVLISIGLKSFSNWILPDSFMKINKQLNGFVDIFEIIVEVLIPFGLLLTQLIIILFNNLLLLWCEWGSLISSASLTIN